MGDSSTVFQSASLPAKGRKGYENCVPHLIRNAVVVLVEVELGRRLLVWSGHPANTPIISDMVVKLGIESQNFMNM